ncbi:OmpA family protein [bacterium]|nr:OmpA family protein [bacterium]
MYRLFLLLTITLLPTFKNFILKQDSLKAGIEQTLKNNTLVIPYKQNNVVLLAGRYSFADSVIMYDPGARGKGTGDEPDARFRHSENAIGVPCNQNDSGFVSLGRGGTIILKFLDNSLIDESGPDLCIFLRARNKESAQVWISRKGNFFKYIGTVDKNNPFLDIKGRSAGELYQYVKIKDVYQNSAPDTPDLGIDIDAVAALHCVIRKTIAGDMLFSPGSSALRDSTFILLDSAADLIKSFDSTFVIIRAYSDGRGSSGFKLLMTQEQAETVRDYFTDHLKITDTVFSVMGMGKQNPVASNDTGAGRMKNRRIEILIYPEK